MTVRPPELDIFEGRGVFKEHLDDAGLTYWQHAWRALLYSVRLLFMSTVCLVHAVVPFLFTNTTSRLVGNLHKDMSREDYGNSDQWW